MKRPITKPGKHGTLYRYAIRYTDESDPGCPEMVWCTWAYDRNHAVDRFYEDGAEGWQMLGEPETVKDQ